MQVSVESKPLNGKRIGLFGKGGAGKSTVTVMLAGAMRQRGYHVNVLDADSTNIGLFHMFEIDHSPKSMMDYFGGTVFGGGVVTCPVDDPMPLVGAEISFENLPAEYYAVSPEGITLFIAGKIGDHGPGAGCDGPVAKIARDLKINMQGKSPVNLIDFKAGFEDTARGVITSLDWAIVVIDPTTVSVEMAANMKYMLEQIKADVLPATAHLSDPESIAYAKKIFVEASIDKLWYMLNRIEDVEQEDYLRQKLSEKGIDLVGVIHQDSSISRSWLKGTTLKANQAMLDVEQILDRLENEG